MNEQVKELIRSVVKPNGAGLINGQNLQDVLIDIVDNAVPASSSYATEAGKVSFKLRISGSGVDAEYDGSQDVTASLENYPDREEVTGEINEATESVKGWVTDQHYLTSASLSGSVTEEVVDMKINDATASVKEWVGEQGYATTSSVNELSSSVSTALGTLATTQSVNQLSQSVAEDFANLDIPDVSGLATTASVNELSSSVAQDFANLDIPDISGLATTASVNELSSSVGAALDTLATTQSLNELSESVSASIAGIEIPDVSGLATTSSVLQVSESVSELSASVASDFENLDIPDISGLATTASVSELSASVAESIENIDLSEYATTASVEESINESTQSVKTWVTNQHYLTSASLSGSVTEEVVEMKINDATASVQQWVGEQGYATTSSLTDLSSSVAQDFENLVIPDVSGFATTSSVTASINEATQSVKTWVGEQGYLTEHQSLAGLFDSASYSSTTKKIYFYDKGENQVGEIDATAFIKDGMVDGVTIDTGSNQLVITFNTDAGKEDITLDLNQIFNPNNYYVKSEVDTIATASVSQSQAWVVEQGYLTEHQDISYLATTASVSSVSESVFNLSSSVASDFENLDIPDVSGLATTASVTELSASVAEDLKNVEVDLSEYATTASVNQLSSSVATDFENLDIPDISGLATTASVTELSESVANNFVKYATTQSINNLSSSVAQDFNSLDQDLDTLATTASVLTVSESVWSLSSSVALDFKNLDIDFSRYATTSSVLQVSESVNNLSSSVAEDFENLDIPDVSSLATTASVSELSSSVAEDFANLDIPDVSGLASTASVLTVSESVNTLSSSVASDFENLDIPDISGLATTASFNDYSSSIGVISASFDQRINEVTGSGDGADTELRNFLFGVETQTITSITGSVTNIVSSVSADATLGFTAVPDEGKSLGIIVHNTGNSAVTLSLSDTVSVGGSTYTLINNGVANSGSVNIAAGEYGDIVVTRIGSNLYLRTSVDLSNIQVDLSSYATTSSLNALSQSAANTYATKTSVTDLSNQVSRAGLWWTGSGRYALVQPFSQSAMPWDSNASIASGISSLAHGYGVRALNSGSHAEGQWTIASGRYSHAEGIGTTASGDFSHAEGSDVTASGAYSHAEGANTKALGQCSHAEGTYTVASGNNSHAEGNQAVASGELSHVEGNSTRASGTSSHAEGNQAVASGDYSHAEGGFKERVSEGGVIVVHHYPGGCAVGYGSHAEGHDTKAVGKVSHAEGAGPSYATITLETTGISKTYNVTSGFSSIVVGDFICRFPSNLQPNIERTLTRVESIDSELQRIVTTDEVPVGEYYIATAVASGRASHIEGEGTITYNEAEHAEGYYNKSSNGTILSVGIGSGHRDRKNAFEVVKDVDGISGSIFVLGVGGYNGTNPQPGQNDLATIVNAGGGQDLSGYATTASLKLLSQSVYTDSASFDQRIRNSVEPDLSVYATTASVNNLSASFASTIPSGSYTRETWTFTLTDSSSVQKVILVG